MSYVAEHSFSVQKSKFDKITGTFSKATKPIVCLYTYKYIFYAESRLYSYSVYNSKTVTSCP